jgi:glutathione S-transferase
MILVIGNKNYSSWSLRPWLAMKTLGLPFEERRIPLDQPDTQQEILKHNPAGKVPCLVDGANVVWDSLAILEYLAEKRPELWPADAAARARARSVAAEMHSGFFAVRNAMPMNVRNRYPGKGRSADVDTDIARIDAIWSAAKKPLLFGGFCAADAMFAPVAFRFRTYEPPLSAAGRAYLQALLALPAMQEWSAAAGREAEVLSKYDDLYA